jgi:glutamine synthetase
VEPQQAVTGDAYAGDDDIPKGLHDALDLFAADDAMAEVLGPEFCKVYTAVKSLEYSEFLQVISPWEREHLLLNV